MNISTIIEYMKLYLVRHGESMMNAQNIHQHSEIDLSEQGVSQAERVAKRVEHIPFDLIMASPFNRAKKTAEIISQHIKIPLGINDLLREIKRPTEIEGKNIDSPEVIKIKNTILDNWHNSNYRHSDEETFYEFKNRAQTIVREIEDLKLEHILLVTHGDLIKVLICLLAFSESLVPDQLKILRKFLHLDNTGITICEYKDHKWKLISWNDCAHISQ